MCLGWLILLLRLSDTSNSIKACCFDFSILELSNQTNSIGGRKRKNFRNPFRFIHDDDTIVYSNDSSDKNSNVGGLRHDSNVCVVTRRCRSSDSIVCDADVYRCVLDILLKICNRGPRLNDGLGRA